MSVVFTEPSKLPVVSVIPALPEPVLPESSSPLSWLDDPVEWRSFSQASKTHPECQESYLLIDGMHCAACAVTLEAALLAVPGVIDAQVNAASHRAKLVWAAAATQPSQWLGAVERAGYHAVPTLDLPARARRLHEQRTALWRWLVAGLCMMQVMMYALPAYVAGPGELTPDMSELLRWASWVLTLPVMVFSCGPFFTNAWRDVRHRRISMDLPAALGMAVTFAVSTLGTFEPDGVFGKEVYFDSLTMFVFFLQTGRWLELRLRDRTAGALETLISRLPDSVERWVSSSASRYERVAVSRLQLGDRIRVLPGEAFPADGTLLSGHTQVDEALLTGESTPLSRGSGEGEMAQVLAGSYNLAAAVELRVDALGADTRFAQIVALMTQAASQKPRLAQLADRVARPFLQAVLLAAALALVYWWPSGPGHALMVMVAVLVVTCPCALSLATPTALLAAAGKLANAGVLVRNLQALESLAQVDTVVFDKTGTLTQGGHTGVTVVATRTRDGISTAGALAMAASLAKQSLHPISRAVVAAEQPEHAGGMWQATSIQEFAGLGLEGEVCGSTDGKTVKAQSFRLRLGSAGFCGVPMPTEGSSQALSQVHLSDESGWLASFEVSEELRPDAALALQALQAAGIHVQILSGDQVAAVERAAVKLGLSALTGVDIRGDCTPHDKLQHLQALQSRGRCVAMVGDGLNDGPVLAGAHVSFAFGEAVPLAQRQADFVVTGGALARIPQTVLLARQTLRVVRQNLTWAAAYNAVCVPLALAGYLPAWLAGLGMALSSLLVVVNALRLSGSLKLVERH